MPFQLAASPQDVETIFQKEYIIPSYQRSYSWDAAHCRKLVDDLVGFHQSGDADPYFLGSIVVAKQQDKQGQDEPLVVIDGQQRLTTLSLLIRVVFNRAQTHTRLLDFLQKKDGKTGEIQDKVRVVSKVLDEDRQEFRDAILGKELSPTSIFAKNMRCLDGALEDQDNKRAIDESGGFSAFVMETLQRRVILLPIVCTSSTSAAKGAERSALRIFRTLNDRGLQLDDSDIFKADLHSNLLSSADHGWFKDNWNGLRADDDEDLVERLFRIDMHVLIAKGDKQVTKEPKLRSFFVDENPNIFAEPRTVIERLKQHRSIFYDWQASPRNNAHINIWWEILRQIPNVWWHYPLFVFLDKHGKWNTDTGTFSLAEEQEDGLVTLIRETARYFYIKGVATNSVDRIKDTVFKVCRAIARGEDYIGLYRDNAKGNNVNDFRAKLERSEYGRYLKGLVLVNSALHPSQEDGKNRQKYADLLTGERGYNYEHILPRRQNHYPEWDKDAHARDLEELGNIIPFEGHLNKRAGNESFALKKDAYKKSELAEVKKLGKKAQWTPEELQKRHNEVIARLLEFFRY